MPVRVISKSLLLGVQIIQHSRQGRAFVVRKEGQHGGLQGKLRTQPCRQRFFKACEDCGDFWPQGRRMGQVCMCPLSKSITT